MWGSWRGTLPPRCWRKYNTVGYINFQIQQFGLAGIFPPGMGQAKKKLRRSRFYADTASISAVLPAAGTVSPHKGRYAACRQAAQNR